MSIMDGIRFFDKTTIKSENLTECLVCQEGIKPGQKIIIAYRGRSRFITCSQKCFNLLPYERITQI